MGKTPAKPPGVLAHFPPKPDPSHNPLDTCEGPWSCVCVCWTGRDRRVGI